MKNQEGPGLLFVLAEKSGYKYKKKERKGLWQEIYLLNKNEFIWDF